MLQPPPGGAPGAGGPPPGMMPGGAGGPAASPMTTPQPQEGLSKAARVKVQTFIKGLQLTLPSFPIESDENKAVLSALKTLSTAFGKTEDTDRKLIPAEVMQMLSSVGPGTQPPGPAAMGAKPMPGMPPGGAPPGLPA